MLHFFWGTRVMKRRKNGEGSYGTKVLHGVTYKFYRAPDRAWTVYARTAKELERKRAEKENSFVQSAAPNGPVTVSELCKKWLLSRKKDITAGTYDNYEDILAAMIVKFKGYDIGNKQVNGLTKEMLESYLFALSNQYSKNSIDRAWTIIKQSIEYGQSNGIMENPIMLKNVKKPSEKNVAVKKKEVHFTTLSDMELLYREAHRIGDNGKPVYGNASKVIVFIMYSGLRVSEAIGLKWKYVKKDLSEIKVMQSHRKIADRDEDGAAILVDGHKTYHKTQKSTKSVSGERTVPLPDRAIGILQLFCEMFPDHKDEDYVFLTSKGTVFMRENVERTLQRMLKRSDCECKDYTPHSLRHGYGSILLSEGVDIKTVSVLLGHKDISTTYNIYIHVLESDKKKAVRNIFNQ